MGDSSYWIPGALQRKVSTPIPPHKASDVKPDADLMWLQAKDATHYIIYLAEAKNGVCDHDILPSAGVSQTSSSNIFKPDALLIPSTSYCWSVDVVTASGVTVKGDLWEFMVGCADLFCSACGMSPTLRSCVSCEAPFEMVDASGVCAPVGGCLGGSWTVVATPDKAWAQTYSVNVAGDATDTFEVREVSSPNCERWNIFTILVVFQISRSGFATEVRNMGCNNKQYTLQQTFACTGGCYADAGFVADASAASGCNLGDSSEAGGTATAMSTDTSYAEAGLASALPFDSDEPAALILGIICSCAVLILIVGCACATWWKRHHDTHKQKLPSNRCNPEDLEKANWQAQTEPGIERPGHAIPVITVFAEDCTGPRVQSHWSTIESQWNRDKRCLSTEL